MAQMIIHGFIALFALSLLVVALKGEGEGEGRDRGRGRGKGEGLSLELIHRYSIHSPLYSPNLTAAEKFKRLVEISDRRALEIGVRSTANASRVMALRPIVGRDRTVYMVKLSIGTPPISTNLDLDTGSSISWTQCGPCRQCFVQAPRLYQATQSTTSHALPCDHPFCDGLLCIDDKCHYNLTYIDGANTKGYLVADRLTFPSHHSSHSEEAVDNIVFGCSGESSLNMYPYGTAVSGILGMGDDARSFLIQLGDRAKGRFSYCLVPPEHTAQSYIRFGTDVEHVHHGHTTPLLTHDDIDGHLIDLKDLSVDGHRLHLPSDTFKTHPGGSGGCLLDTASWINYMVENALDALVHSLERYFRRHHLTRVEDPNHGYLKLCYTKPSGFSSYPAIAFHLRGGAVFRPKPESLFFFGEASDTFCLAVKEAHNTIIGSVTQQNFRMVIDREKDQLTFAEEDCAGN